MFFQQPRSRPIKSILPAPSKKRKAFYAIEEISFDNAARVEYLTGFHKRKIARQKQAQKTAAVKERLERIEFRKQIREDRRMAVEEHVLIVTKLLREAKQAGQDDIGGDNDSEDAWQGITDEIQEETPYDQEEEYVDEDRYTTVTVEAVNIDRHGVHKPQAEPDKKDMKSSSKAEGESSNNIEKRPKKKKKKKNRYKTKAKGVSLAKEKAKARR